MSVLHTETAAEITAQPPPTVAQRRWVPKGYLAEVINYLRFLVPSGAAVLEIGCRDGEVLGQLSSSRGVGLDGSADLIARAHARHPSLTFAVWTGGPLPVEGSFDVIIVRHALEFMPDLQATLTALRTLCHPATRLILITHNYLWAPALVLLERLGLKRTRGMYAWLTLNDLGTVLSLAGYEAVRQEYRTPMPVWIPGLSWLINRVLGKLPGLWKLGIDQWVVARPLHLKPASGAPAVSVIVPCRNERGTVKSLVERMPRLGRRTELIFIEGHSTDGTLEELRAVQDAHRELDITVLTQTGRGKGDAVRRGIEASSGELLVILDADLSVDPEVLPRFVEALILGHCEMALGSRLVYPMPAQAMRPLNMAANMLFGRALSFILGVQVKDALCGTKAFWRMDYQRIARQRAFFGFDPFGDFDLILGAAKLSLKISEIPVQYRERVYGTTNIRRWRDGFLLSRMLVRSFLKMKLQ